MSKDAKVTQHDRVDWGYKPTGQRGYQPQSSKPLDPMKLKPPTGGSAVQPPSIGTVHPNNNAAKK